MESKHSQFNLKDLHWLTGRWIGFRNGKKIEEVWMKPDGGLILGLHQEINDSNSSFFEYQRIEKEESNINFHASPQGKKETVYQLNILKNKYAVFENFNHDFPKRIIYSIEEDSTLFARADDGYDETTKKLEWRYRKVDTFKKIKIDQVTIATNNMEKMLEFYETIFEMKFSSPSGEAVDDFMMCRVNDILIMLCSNKIAGVKAEQNRFQFDFVVGNLENLCENVKNTDGKILSDIEKNPKFKIITIADPDGNTINFKEYVRK